MKLLKLLGFLLCALCLLSDVLVAAVAQTTIIDVCAKTKDPKTSLNVLAAPANGNDDVLVRLENCALPDHLDLTISIPAYNGKSTGKTTISVRHVSAESTGSIIIKPDLTDPGSGTHLAAYGLLHNVEIDVGYAALHAKEDLLVVDTTAASITAERPYMMTAVTMRVFHSALRSDDGSIAAFITPHNGGVRNVNMYIGTNSTFKTVDQFIGSIVAGTVIDSKLIVNSGNVVGSGGSCDGGPVEFDAGSTSFLYDVGVLSVGMTRKSDNALTARALKVQNVEIIVNDGTYSNNTCIANAPTSCGTPNNIDVSAESSNMASFASFGVAAEDVGVTVTGFFDIRFVLSNRMESVTHQFEASGQREGAAIGSIVAVSLATKATTNVELSSASVNIYWSVSNSAAIDETDSNIKADASSERVASVLGVAALSSPMSGEGKVVFTMDSSALVISGRFINSKGVNMGATTQYTHSATALLGVVVVTDRFGSAATSMVVMKNKSNITIVAFTSLTDLVTLQAATVFGIGCEAFSDEKASVNAVASFSVGPESRISILGSITNDPTPMRSTTYITSDGVAGTTQSALGISVASHLGSSTTGGTKTANMYVKGSVTIDVSMNKTMVSTTNSFENYFALLGTVVYGGSSGTLHVQGSGHVAIAVNAVETTFLNARGTFVVNVGIRSNAAVDGMSASNTKLSFCKGTSVFHFPADKTVIVMPAVSGVSFSQLESTAVSCVQQVATLGISLDDIETNIVSCRAPIQPAPPSPPAPPATVKPTTKTPTSSDSKSIPKTPSESFVISVSTSSTVSEPKKKVHTPTHSPTESEELTPSKTLAAVSEPPSVPPPPTTNNSNPTTLEPTSVEPSTSASPNNGSLAPPNTEAPSDAPISSPPATTSVPTTNATQAPVETQSPSSPTLAPLPTLPPSPPPPRTATKTMATRTISMSFVDSPPPTVSTPSPPVPTPEPPTPTPESTVVNVTEAPPLAATTETQKETVTAVTSTVMVGAAANSAGPGLQDMQALVVLGSMSCATPDVRAVSSGGDRSVIPFEIPVLEEGSHARTMVSIIIILSGVLAVHLSAVGIVMVKRQKTFLEACGLARFPAWSFSAFVLLYQGITLVAFRAVFDSSSATGVMDRGLGAAFVIVAVAVPAISPVLRIRGNWPATFLFYEHSFTETPKLVRLLIFPAGFYDGSPRVDPNCIVRRFSTMFTGVADTTNPLFTTLGFAKAFFVALISSLPPDTLNCTTRFTIIGMISLLLAAVMVLCRPWRVPLDNILSCLSNICTALLCFVSVEPDVVGNSSVIVTMTVGLGLVSSICGIGLKLLEVLKWKKEEQRRRLTTDLNVPLVERPKSASSPRKAGAKVPAEASDASDTDEDRSILQVVTTEDHSNVNASNPLQNGGKAGQLNDSGDVESGGDSSEESSSDEDASSSSWSERD